MKKTYKYLNSWQQFKIRKKYRQFMAYFISVMSVFLVIAFYFLYISGTYDVISKSVYKFFGMSEFSSNADSYPFSVHFIDVGNGDAILVHTENTDLMIDAGEYSLNGTSAEYLQHFGTDDIDLFIATHNDSDHIGDFSHIAEKFKIHGMWINKYAYDEKEDMTENEKIMYEIAQKYDISIESPEIGRYKVGDLYVDVLSPDKQYSNDNDNSIVVKISYKDISVLFTGDAGNAAENELLKNNADISADILKVSHHGSKTGTSSEFIEAVCPKYAVISVGKGNKYLPNNDTVKRINEAGASICRTDYDGCVILASDGNSIDVFKEKSGTR